MTTSIRVFRPGRRDLDTRQRPKRLPQILLETGAESAEWEGPFQMEPGERTGIHHHGACQMIAYVLDGVCEVRWGERGEQAVTANSGDLVRTPAWLPHREINPSQNVVFRWIVIHPRPAPPIINLPDDFWDRS